MGDAMTSGTVSLADSRPPLVLALDLGSSSVRCGVYDSGARAVKGMASRLPHRLGNQRDGSSTADPDALLAALFQCVDSVMERLGSAASEIVAAGTCTFVTNVMGTDAAGRPVMPLTTYGDTTSWGQAERLAVELDPEAVHQRVGCYFHPSYLPSRFRRWQETDPARFGRVTRWITLGEYLERVLFGPSVNIGLTHSVASWTGLLNRHTLDWDEELLEHLGVDIRTLPGLIDIAPTHRVLLPQFAARWPALEKVQWFPAIGDGAAANIGSAKSSAAGTVVVTLGTTGAMRVITDGPLPHIPDGLWCYRVDRKRLLPGGALSEGGNIHAWMRETLNLAETSRLEKIVAAMDADAHGLTVLPFFAGERSPGWRGRASATLHGITLATTPQDIIRAGMESVALRLGMIFDRLRPLLPQTDPTVSRQPPIVAGGRALVASPAWAQILADVLGYDVEVCALEETSSRGVALLMLSTLQALSRDGYVDVPGTLYHPDPQAHAVYQAARERQIRLYDFICRNDDNPKDNQ